MFLRLCALVLLLAVYVHAQTACETFYLCTKGGHVYEVDRASKIAVYKTAVTGSVGQIIGAAWDPATMVLYMNDRNGGQLFKYDPTTNQATLADSGSQYRNFQGGAIKTGSKLYGIDESQQKVLKYIDLSTPAPHVVVEVANEEALPQHTHALGVDSGVKGRGDFAAYYGGNVYSINTDGSVNAEHLSVNSTTFLEDIEGILDTAGSYLGVIYSSSTTAVKFIDGATGYMRDFGLTIAGKSSFSTNLGGLACVRSEFEPPAPEFPEVAPPLCECEVVHEYVGEGEYKARAEDLPECCDRKSTCLVVANEGD